MIRFAPLVLLVACAEPAPTETFEQAASPGFTRTHVSADIYHYEAVIPVGDTPNAALRIHRVVREAAPFVPRKTKRVGRFVGRKPEWKKAIVKLAEGQSIEFFEGV